MSTFLRLLGHTHIAYPYKILIASSKCYGCSSIIGIKYGRIERGNINPKKNAIKLRDGIPLTPTPPQSGNRFQHQVGNLYPPRESCFPSHAATFFICFVSASTFSKCVAIQADAASWIESTLHTAWPIAVDESLCMEETDFDPEERSCSRHEFLLFICGRDRATVAHECSASETMRGQAA